MLKIVKTKITQDEFIQEAKTLFPDKFTEAGLRVLFEYIETHKYGEYELYKISDDFEEWTFKKFNSYLVERYGDSSEDSDLANKELEIFLYEEVGEDGRDEWVESIVGFTDSTIVFTIYYVSHLERELKKMYERMRIISLEQFYKEFDCSSDSVMDVFEKYRNGSFLNCDRNSKIFHLDFRNMTDTKITFEQYMLPN
jgi:hypothetical protein